MAFNTNSSEYECNNDLLSNSSHSHHIRKSRINSLVMRDYDCSSLLDRYWRSPIDGTIIAPSLCSQSPPLVSWLVITVERSVYIECFKYIYVSVYDNSLKSECDNAGMVLCHDIFDIYQSLSVRVVKGENIFLSLTIVI